MTCYVAPSSIGLLGLAGVIALCLAPFPREEAIRCIMISGLAVSITLANLGAANATVVIYFTTLMPWWATLSVYIAFLVTLTAIAYSCDYRLSIVGREYLIGPFMALASAGQGIASIIGACVLDAASKRFNRAERPIGIAELWALVAFFGVHLAIARSHPSAQQESFPLDVMIISLGVGFATAAMGMIVIWFSSEFRSPSRLTLIGIVLGMDRAIAPSWVIWHNCGLVIRDERPWGSVARMTVSQETLP